MLMRWLRRGAFDRRHRQASQDQAKVLRPPAHFSVAHSTSRVPVSKLVPERLQQETGSQPMVDLTDFNVHKSLIKIRTDFHDWRSTWKHLAPKRAFALALRVSWPWLPFIPAMTAVSPDPSLAQTFQIIAGPVCDANGMSADGKVVVGSCGYSGNSSWRWA